MHALKLDNCYQWFTSLALSYLDYSRISVVYFECIYGYLTVLNMD